MAEVSSAYLVVPEDAFDVVERRRSFSLQSIVEVRLDIEERKRLGQEHHEVLEHLLIDLRSSLRMVAAVPPDPEAQRLYVKLQRDVLELTSQQSQVPIETWRDVIELKKELRALLREYWGTPRP